MNFKEILRADVTNTFLNLSEFADYHVLNGKKIRAVIDKSSVQGEITVKFHRQQARQQTRLYNVDVVIYVSAAEFGKPKPGSLMELDGKKYIAQSATEMGGIYKIEMQKAGGI